jgi:hypothetical protein
MNIVILSSAEKEFAEAVDLFLLFRANQIIDGKIR